MLASSAKVLRTAVVVVLVTLFSVAAAGAQERLYVANGAVGTISVIDVATNTVVDTISVGGQPWSLALNSAGTKLYVADNFNGQVLVLNTETYATEAIIPLDGRYSAIACVLTPDGTELWVAPEWGASVRIIDTTTNTWTDTIAGTFSYGISFTMDATGTKAFLTTGFSAVNVFDVETHAFITQVGGIPNAWYSTPSADGSMVYVSARGADSIAFIDTAAEIVVDNVVLPPIGGVSPSGLGVAPGANKLYVATPASSSTTVVNLSDNSVAAIPMQTSAICATAFCLGEVVFTADGNYAYVSTYSSAGGESVVHVIDTTAEIEVATIPVGLGPIGLAMAPADDPHPDFDFLTATDRLKRRVKRLGRAGKLKRRHSWVLLGKLNTARRAYEKGYIRPATRRIVEFRRFTRYLIRKGHLDHEAGRPLIRGANYILRNIADGG